MLTLDGSLGEGGGQILRSALALSMVTGQAFHLTRIRARRPKPGLMRQHLACVDAATRLAQATTDGATLGSTELRFQPRSLIPGNYEFKIGSAGSTLLLLQAILPPLLLVDQPSEIAFEGGTHNSFAPPFPFIENAFLPLVRSMGYSVEAVLERAGFYPNGGGRCRVTIAPRASGVPFTRMQSETPSLSAIAYLAGLGTRIGERELSRVRQKLAIPPENCSLESLPDALGPGNSVHVFARFDGYAEVFTGFGAPKVTAETVADEAVAEAEAFLNAQIPVGPHLADQLLLPLALGSGGEFLTMPPTEHTRTNAEIIWKFMNCKIEMTPISAAQWRIAVEGKK